jgi:hypothetical protein
MAKLGPPAKDVALGLGLLPACVRESISLEETGCPATVSQAGRLKETKKPKF